ncbi:phosphoadenosine phosphosulfate reductase family protein [Pyrodictium abyssi]|uniref:Phosphoadenosine phosphosulphate reductase domain-containing protein n=1 Tax=Pyrodictium abyssi TaxID=54256 RepID=A0ABM8IU64_9CREN|nr:hypothetical protein PABY_06680 [Pyrodictium abyssi]
MALQGLLEALERLGWLREPSVPVLGCRGSGKACWRVRGDYWLAGRYERSLLDTLSRLAFGADLGLRDRLVVFHRVPAPGGEYAAEVFAEALRLGVVEYTRRGWVLHPSGALAGLAASRGAEVLEVRSSGPRLKGKRVRLSPESCRGRRWVIVGSRGWVGPARVTGADGEACTAKVKDMAPRGLSPLPPAELEAAIEKNAEIVGGLAAEAREFIRRVYARVQASQGRVYVAFSGGADSTAVLSLAREALGPERVVAVYADTGMEYPEARRHAERIAAILGVDLEVVEPDTSPLDEVRKRGLMTRDDRWCTRLLKLQPLRRFYSRVGARLVLDGARRWESTNRARTPRLGKNPLIPGVVRALPIHHWPRLAVQLYLAERGIPVSQLYQEGLTRIGCIACPAMHLYEIHLAYRLHPWWYRRLAEAVAEHQGTSEEEALRLLLAGEWRRGGEPETWLQQ